MKVIITDMLEKIVVWERVYEITDDQYQQYLSDGGDDYHGDVYSWIQEQDDIDPISDKEVPTDKVRDVGDTVVVIE